MINLYDSKSDKKAKKKKKRIHEVEAMNESTGEDKTEETVPENRLMPQGQANERKSRSVYERHQELDRSSFLLPLHHCFRRIAWRRRHWRSLLLSILRFNFFFFAIKRKRFKESLFIIGHGFITDLERWAHYSAHEKFKNLFVFF